MTRVLGKVRDTALDRLLPVEPAGMGQESRTEYLRRARLLVAATVFLTFTSAFFLGLIVILDRPGFTPTTVALAGAVMIAASIVWGFRVGLSLSTASWLLILVIPLTQLIISTDALGLHNPSLWWILSLPILATVLIGERAAVFSVALVVVVMGIVFVRHPTIAGVKTEFDDLFTLLSVISVCIFIGWLAVLSERQRLASQERHAQVLNDLQVLNRELSASNEAKTFAHKGTLREADLKERFIVRMKHESERQHIALDQTGESMRSVESAASILTESADTLATSALQSSTAVRELTRNNESVLESVEDLVSTSSTAMKEIENMTVAIREISDAIAGLAVSAEESSMSMTEMAASTAHIQENANTTAELAEMVIRDAERGVEKVNRTVRGIEAIQTTSAEVFETIRRLDRQSTAITEVLVVIDDVTHQTNLLALNAAILAAQAGDEGQGFAVVADEIKKLAERTRSSTTTIAELILAVRDEAKNAVGAIRRGEDAVATGVRLSEESEAAFSTIVESAKQSTEMARAIASASGEQLQGARIVTLAAQQVADTVSDVADMSLRQAEGSENIVRAATRMRSVAEHVERATHEGARAGQEIVVAMTRLSEMSVHLNDAQQRQREGARSVLDAIEEIRHAQNRQNKSLLTLAGDLDDEEKSNPGAIPAAS